MLRGDTQAASVLKKICLIASNIHIPLLSDRVSLKHGDLPGARTCADVHMDAVELAQHSERHRNCFLAITEGECGTTGAADAADAAGTGAGQLLALSDATDADGAQPGSDDAATVTCDCHHPHVDGMPFKSVCTVASKLSARLTRGARHAYALSLKLAIRVVAVQDHS